MTRGSTVEATRWRTPECTVLGQKGSALLTTRNPSRTLQAVRSRTLQKDDHDEMPELFSVSDSSDTSSGLASSEDESESLRERLEHLTSRAERIARNSRAREHDVENHGPYILPMVFTDAEIPAR